MLKVSAGILLIYNKKVLLAHSTNSPWWRSYTPPKGGLEENETLAEAASREVEEEVGIKIDSKLLDTKISVEYKKPSGSVYKLVHLFVYQIKSLQEIGLEEEIVPVFQLQREEVDEARFMDREEVQKKILPRYLDYILPFIR